MDFFFGRQQDRFNYSKFVSGNDARFRAVAAVLLCLIIPQTLQAADHPDIDGVELCKGEVDRIYFTGNETTRESVFRQEMQIREGEPCSLESISESRQNIMDLGIFSSVSVSLTRYTGRLVLRFDVKEKHFVLPIPRLSRTSSGEIRLGGQLRMDNVAGLNHRLKLTSERQAEDDGAGRKGFEHNFEYEIPRIQNTRYGLKLRLERLDKQYQLKRDGIDYGESNRIGNAFEIGLLRRRSKGAGTKDWLSWYRLRYEHRRIELTEGELGPFESGRNLELAVGIGRNQVNLEKYRRRGHVYGTSLSLGLDTLGADYRYQRIDAFYRGYRPIEASTLTNVNYNVELGYSNGEPFGDRAFSIGGGESLRGLEQRSVDGDVKLLLNLEYLKALADHPSVRFAGFWDVANVFPRWDFKPVHTENGIGVGLRWKIVSFVQVDLRVDYAVSLSEKKGYTYFATNLNF